MKSIIIFLIRLYQHTISLMIPFNHCRFYPSCSEYSLGAIEAHGIFCGFRLTMRRISKCHPFSTSGGYDPVP